MPFMQARTTECNVNKTPGFDYPTVPVALSSFTAGATSRSARESSDKLPATPTQAPQPKTVNLTFCILYDMLLKGLNMELVSLSFANSSTCRSQTENPACSDSSNENPNSWKRPQLPHLRFWKLQEDNRKPSKPHMATFYVLQKAIISSQWAHHGLEASVGPVLLGRGFGENLLYSRRRSHRPCSTGQSTSLKQHCRMPSLALQRVRSQGLRTNSAVQVASVISDWKHRTPTAFKRRKEHDCA